MSTRPPNDDDPARRPADEPGQDPRKSWKNESHSGKDFRDSEEELEPPRQRCVHLRNPDKLRHQVASAPRETGRG
jgi:hypothetical protein